VLWSGVGLVVMALFAGVLGRRLAGRALRPVAAITGAARQISEENLHQRLSLTGPDDELHRLADTFDTMLDRLEKSFESQRRFVANASHELKTPLGVWRQTWRRWRRRAACASPSMRRRSRSSTATRCCCGIS